MIQIREVKDISELNNVELASGLQADASDNTIYFSSPILDKANVVFSRAYPIKAINSQGQIENMKVPPRVGSGDSVTAGFSDDGMVAYGVKRGLAGDGLDDDTTIPGNLIEFNQGDEVICPVNAVIYTQLNRAIEGDIATGSTKIVIGDGESDEAIINRADSSGNEKKWLRNDGSNAYISANGVDEINIFDITDGQLVKASVTDTTAGYIDYKVQPGNNMYSEIINSGGNEYKLLHAESQREGIVEQETYTQAYWSGGSSPETNISLWNDITDGSWQFIKDGTTYNIIADFSDTGDLGEVTSMAEVASVMQYYSRLVTGDEETYEWDGSKIVVTSDDTSFSSEISGFGAHSPATGTDISSSTWTDLASGSETVPVLDPTADSGKVLLLTSQGNLSAKGMTGEASVTENDVLAVDSSGNVKTLNIPYARLQAKNFNPVTHTGTTSRTNILSTSIPANLLTGRSIKVTAYVSNYNVGTGDGITTTISLGSTDLLEWLYSAPSTVTGIKLKWEANILDNGANSQKGMLHTTFLNTSNNDTQYFDEGASSEDTTNALDLDIDIELSDASNTITIDYILVELI